MALANKGLGAETGAASATAWWASARARPERRAPATERDHSLRPSRQLAVKGALLAGAASLGRASATPGASACKETAGDVLGALLTTERLAMTFYATALAAPAIVGAGHTASRSTNIPGVSRIGGSRGIARLQAILEQERQHAQLLVDLGAASPHTSFYFPTAVFDRVGYTSKGGTFLWTLDRLETALIGAYLAAVMRLGALGHRDFAVLAARVLGTECEHRALGRAIAGDDPVDNVTLEVSSFTCVAGTGRVFDPYITGRGLSGPIRRHAAPN